MSSFLRLRNSNYLLFWGLCLLVTGLPVSLFLTSLSQFFIVGSFFLEGSPVEKWKRFLTTKSAVLLAILWLLHVLGLAWTQDLQEGLKDIRIKLPLLILPFVLSGSEPLKPGQFRIILVLFIASVFAGSLVAIAVLKGLLPTKAPIYDIREIFNLGVSHIRFALFTCLAAIIAGYLLLEKSQEKTKVKKVFLIILIFWFIAFLFIIESITGISIVLLIGLILLWSIIIQRTSLYVRIIAGVLLVSIPLSLYLILKDFVHTYSPKPPEALRYDLKTKQGNLYFFDTTNTQVENGSRVYAYICEEEMRNEWNKRSEIPFDSLDERKQPIKSTLLRFLASKGSYKDAEGVAQLTEEEVKSVEHGIANVYYQHLSSIKSRMLQILWEYHEYSRGGDPSGHSVTQRLEFWKAAVGIIAAKPLAGVGTGDMRAAYQQEYERMQTKLTPHYRLRAHNQYLAIGVALGLPALLFFIFVLFIPLMKEIREKNFLFLAFWLIAICSMITEDTLETQAGVTFVALFWSLFVFSNPHRKSAELK